MPAATAARLTRGKLIRLAHAGLDSVAYRRRAIRDLRAVLPFDAAWWWTIDPASALVTSGVFEPPPSGHAIRGGLHGDEFGDTDYSRFRVLAPLNYEHELRLALSDDSAL
jgi:hypothetical protein